MTIPAGMSDLSFLLWRAIDGREGQSEFAFEIRKWRAGILSGGFPSVGARVVPELYIETGAGRK